MKRIALLVLLITAVTGMVSSRAAAQTDSLKAAVNQYMKAEVNVNHFMGSILVAKGDYVIITKGYGKANVKKDISNTPNTEFHIGSVTKQFTAMAILMLQDEGKLNVQDPVCKYVPKCPDDWQPITIYNLLTHTSGIPDYLDEVSRDTMKERLETSHTPAQLLGFFKDKPLNFKPGKKFSYSNSGYVLLGYIISRVSGESYGQFLQRHIFGPLGMKHSGFGNIDSTNQLRAEGYRYSGQYTEALDMDFANAIGDGGIYSTVKDMYTWDRALESNKLIPASLQKNMFEKQIPVKGGLAKLVGSDNGVYYGFGWFISEKFGHKNFSHEGAVPGFTSLNSWFPEQDLYVIVLDNMTSGRIFKIAKNLAAIVFGKKYKTPKPFKKISLPTKALKKFVGTYQVTSQKYMYITLKGDQLKSQLTGQPVYPIYPESNTRFFIKTKMIRAEIYFKTNDNGKVTGAELHQGGHKMSAEKVNPAKAPKPTSELKAITLPPGALQKFAGIYKLKIGAKITISLKDSQLTARVAGQRTFSIYPESKTEFFLKAVDAKVSFKINNKGKVTGLIWHQGGRDIPGKRVGSAKVPKPSSKLKAIPLPPETLKKYKGTYQLAPNFALTITVKGDHLMARGTGQSAAPIFPESKTEFFAKVNNAKFTFVFNDKGEVTKLILHQHGRNMPAKKVK